MSMFGSKGSFLAPVERPPIVAGTPNAQVPPKGVLSVPEKTKTIPAASNKLK